MAGVADQVDVHVGTLSKAVGSQGGFVACSRNIKSLLLNRGRPYVYSTALPLPTVAAASAALKVSETVCPCPLSDVLAYAELFTLRPCSRILPLGSQFV